MIAYPDKWFSYRALSVAMVAAGCVADLDQDAESEVAAEITAANGISVNGISVNGISVNGISVNGISVNGISVNGVSVSGTQLQGVRTVGGAVSGAGMVGTKLQALLSNGAMLDLRIDGSAMLPASNADMRTYSISYSTTTGWKPLCVGATRANEAILFPGTWNGERHADQPV